MKPHPTRRSSSAVVAEASRPARWWEAGAGGRCGCRARVGKRRALRSPRDAGGRRLPGGTDACVWSKQAMTSTPCTATRVRRWARWTPQRSTLATGDADANPLAGDEALSARVTPRAGAASAADRAAGPRGRVEADPRLRTGRIRQVQVARGVAGGNVRLDRRELRCVAGARLRGQRPGDLLELPRRRVADRGARGRRERARCPGLAAAATDPDGAHDSAQRRRRDRQRHRAGARRLPPGRLPRDPERDGVPARPPAAAAAPRDRQSRRPGVAAGPAAGARRAGRGPGC